MKVLLVDVDSKIPNLPLMKLSTYYQELGDEIGFNVSDPDIIYASVIFSKNHYLADSLRFLYPDTEMHIGGTGFDLTVKLPINDNIAPDYALYPECNYSLGFTTRGCSRNCSFCVVPEKEGKLHIAQHPEEFHNPAFNKIMLLDNNILALKDWFFKVTDWILDNKLQVDFCQGLDIRLIDEEIAARLKELKSWKTWKFAFDSTIYEDSVISGIQMLKDAGIDTKTGTMFYVYLDGDYQFNDALYRCLVLKRHRAGSYLMINQYAKRTPRMTALKRWCRPWIYWSSDFCDYNINTISEKQARLDISGGF